MFSTFIVLLVANLCSLMKQKQLLYAIEQAKEGKEAAFNQFFKELYAACKIQLLAYTDSEENAKEAFSEAMYRFWQKFVVQKTAIPKTNIKGYIFMMAKHYLIDEQRKRQRQPILIEASELVLGKKYATTEDEFWKEQTLEDTYLEALSNAIPKLGTKCRKLFHLMVDKGLEKPKDLWQPLGYSNARTMSSVKFSCIQKLKLETLKELDRLIN